MTYKLQSNITIEYELSLAVREYCLGFASRESIIVDTSSLCIDYL